MTFQKSHFINGSWVAGNGAAFHSINPATGNPVWHGHMGTEEEIDQAVMAAKKALAPWKKLTIEQRITILEAFAFSVKKNKELLSIAISEETGKPLWESNAEVQAMIDKVAISIEAYHVRCQNTEKEDVILGAKLVTEHRAQGVLAVLGPFNFPGHLPNGHIIPALLAGNTIVFKPSEETPMVAELTLKYWQEAKLPAGVINLVQGGSDTGKLLSSHPLIDGLLFTGSWNVGQKLSILYATTPYKMLALEMGGNNALIVSKIKDIDASSYAAILSTFLTSGQRCTCARRLILVKGKTSEDFLKRFIEMTKSLKISAYNDLKEPFMGPVISAKAAANILNAYNKLIALGSKPLVPMTLLKDSSALLSPAILDSTGVKNIPDIEIFGPLTQVYWVDNLEDAITLANGTAYGLTAGLLSDDPLEFEEFFTSSKAGVINWNTPTTGARSSAPFGGRGQSGNNRPSGYYAADYCAYPIASLQSKALTLPKTISPGITF